MEISSNTPLPHGLEEVEFNTAGDDVGQVKATINAGDAVNIVFDVASQEVSPLKKILRDLYFNQQAHTPNGLTLTELLERVGHEFSNHMGIIGLKCHFKKQWLIMYALVCDPCIKIHWPSKRLCYKPKYIVKNPTELLCLLKKREVRGLGGILMAELKESVPKAREWLKVLGENVTVLSRPYDKKRIVFYNDSEFNKHLSEYSKTMWASLGLSVDNENDHEDSQSEEENFDYLYQFQ